MTWRFGGHNDWFSVSVSEPNFRLRFNSRASTLYQNFDDAADHAAQLLFKEWGDRPLYLSLSGGLDSEFTARILLKNKIPFIPIIVKIGTLNQSESWYAEYWCHVNSIQPIILEYTIDAYVDCLALLSPKLKQIKNFYMTTSMLIYEYVDQLDGYCIFCGGDVNLDSASGKFYCRSLDFASNLVDDSRHPTSFFMYTPELVLSYINKFDIAQDEQYNKLSFYNVTPRPKIDYIPALNANSQYREVMGKLSHLLKTDPFDTDTQKFWYGTKEQLIQTLQP